MKRNRGIFHKKVVCFIKYNKLFLNIYRILGNTLIFCLKLFVSPNNKQILFMSFGGQKFDDSPKALYDAICQDPFFKDYTLVWGFTEPLKHNVSCKKVKVDTVGFYKAALSSGIWINNSSVSRGLNLKGKGIFEINTWHGTPLKKMGNDIVNNQSYSTNSKKDMNVIYCSQSEYDREIFTRLFNTVKEQILISDLPRNDMLLMYSDEKINMIKRSIGVDKDKKIILYAPTFREYDRNSSNACYIKPPIDLTKWREKLGSDYVVLFRAHYEVIHVLGIQDDEFIKNVSAYPLLNDLMVISDMLISDYSSIYFDYSILEKPMFNFSYDYDTYCEKRGLYLDLNDTLPCKVNLTEDTLLEELQTFDHMGYCEKSKSFKQRFCPNAGHAIESMISVIKKKCEGGL